MTTRQRGTQQVSVYVMSVIIGFHSVVAVVIVVAEVEVVVVVFLIAGVADEYECVERRLCSTFLE